MDDRKGSRFAAYRRMMFVALEADPGEGAS